MKIVLVGLLLYKFEMANAYMDEPFAIREMSKYPLPEITDRFHKCCDMGLKKIRDVENLFIFEVYGAKDMWQQIRFDVEMESNA